MNISNALISIPEGMDNRTLATLTGSEILTNKTLRSPNIDEIYNGSYRITLPSKAGTLAIADDISGPIYGIKYLLMEAYLSGGFNTETNPYYPSMYGYWYKFMDKDILDLSNVDLDSLTAWNSAYTNTEYFGIRWNTTNPPTLANMISAIDTFARCDNLFSVTFPSSVTFANLTNASGMFAMCGIKSINFPKSVTFSKLTNALNVFFGAWNLTSFTMSGVAATKLKSLRHTQLIWDITPTNDNNLHKYLCTFDPNTYQHRITAETSP